MREGVDRFKFNSEASAYGGEDLKGGCVGREREWQVNAKKLQMGKEW